MAKLYEINENIAALMAQMEAAMEENGEISDSLLEQFNTLQLEKSEKLENIACFIKELKYDSDALAEEKKKLDARKKSVDRRIEWLKQYLDTALEGEKLKSARVSVSYRNVENGKTVIDDWTQLPYQYRKEPTSENDFKKTEIGAALKDGLLVPGEHLEDSHSIIIK